jgi:hypothetical protein
VGELVIDQPQALRQIASLVPRHALSPMDMVERAVTAGAGIEVIERLMALHERHEANTARKAFDEAMAAAKAEIPVILKNRTVDYDTQKGRTHYRHEDMGQIARTVDPILAQHGLSYRYRTKSEGGVVSVTCIVSHAKGHSEENTLTCGVDTSGSKNAIQAIGSACTYLQRYSLKAALGLAASDDDAGRAAGDKGSNGASGVITDEQVAEIGRYIAKTNSNIGLFCKAMGVEIIPDIPAARYSHAIAMLKAKEARQAAEGGAS